MFLIAALALCASCTSGYKPAFDAAAVAPKPTVVTAPAEKLPVVAEVVAPPPPAPPPAPVAPTPRPVAIGPCYSGYCPCDTNDRDFGGIDSVLCGMIRRGHRPTQQELMMGEGARDARRQIRQAGY